jgi:hypothetical protein
MAYQPKNLLYGMDRYMSTDEAGALYLKLDQSTPQTVTGGAPIFGSGLTLNDGTSVSPYLNFTTTTNTHTIRGNAGALVFTTNSTPLYPPISGILTFVSGILTIAGSDTSNPLNAHVTATDGNGSGTTQKQGQSIYLEAGDAWNSPSNIHSSPPNGGSVYLVGGIGYDNWLGQGGSGGSIYLAGGAPGTGGTSGKVVITGPVDWDGITGNIDFGTNNILTSGTLGAGAITGTSLNSSLTNINAVGTALTFDTAKGVRVWDFTNGYGTHQSASTIDGYTPTATGAWSAWNDIWLNYYSTGNVFIGDGSTSPRNLYLDSRGAKLYLAQNSGVAGRYTSLSSGTLAASIDFTLPITYPAANDYPLISSTAGVMSWNDQALKTTSSPTFANITDSGLTASLGVYTNGSKQLTSTVPTSGILGHWTRSGTTLSQGVANDAIDLGSGTLKTTGAVGFGAAPSASNNLYSYRASTAASQANINSYNIVINNTYSGTSAMYFYNLPYHTSGQLDSAYGVFGYLENGARTTGTLYLGTAVFGIARQSSANAATCMRAMDGYVLSDASAGTVTWAAGHYARAFVGASSIISNLYHFHATDATGTGTLTTQAGLWIDPLTKGGTNYGVAVDSDVIGLTLGADQDVLLYADGAGSFYFKPAANTDMAVNFFGTTTSGLFTWMEDEDYFKFADDLFLDKKIVGYNNVATEGYGVPAIVDHVALTAQGASIGTTNFTNAGTAGLYRVNYVLEATTLNAGATTVMATFGWTDDAGATTTTSAALVLTALGRTSGIFYVQLASGNLTYATTYIDVTGLSRYAIYCTVERLN